jgi:hypothetical protein
VSKWKVWRRGSNRSWWSIVLSIILSTTGKS